MRKSDINLREEKTCNGCNLVKPLDEFYRRSKNSGYRSLCKPCFTAKTMERYKSKPEAVRATRQAYEATHKKEIKIKRDRWYVNNPRYNHEYYQAHKKIMQAKSTRWRQLNRERANAYYRMSKHRRRFALQGLPNFTRTEWFDLCDRCLNLCVACLRCKPLTVDHIVPVACGGTNTIDNIQPLCKSCNSSKGTKTLNYLRWFGIVGE